MLKKDACIAKFGVSTAENGPSKVWVTHTGPVNANRQ